jgi:Uma2 family endonuclease
MSGMPEGDPHLTSSPGVKLTCDDLLRLPDDGMRHEVIDGEHYVTTSPNTKHQRVAGSLHALIWTYLRTHRIGHVFIAPFDVVFSTFDVVEPDILYLSNARAAAVLTPLNVNGSPELVVEVGSPDTRARDERIKRRLYERSAVEEYWVVDPELDVVRVYHREGVRFARPVELTLERNDVLTTPLLPDLRLPLSEIFGE